MISIGLLVLASQARADDALRGPVLDLLNAYEHGATATDLDELGEGVPAELMAIAADPEVPHSRRGRAVSALAHFPRPAVRTFLVAQLDGTDGLLRRKASFSLAKAYGAEALPDLERALGSEDVQLRAATVRAVATVDGEASRALLTRHRAAEAHTTVLSALESVGVK